MKRRECKKPYKKPEVTRVQLSVEHNVLQGCHGGLPNETGYDFETCNTAGICLKDPPG